MTDPFIITGSRKRVSLPLLKWCPSPVVLVEPQEVDAYRAAWPELDIVELPKNDGGFGYMMNQCCETAKARGHRYFVFTDDDVTDLRVRVALDEKFTSARGEAARTVLGFLVDDAAEHSLAQLAVSFAGQSWGAKKALQAPTGAWGMHVTDTRAVDAVGGYDESLLIFNDWDLSAKLLRAKYWTTRTNLVSFVHRMKGVAGGADEIYARQSAVADAAETVARRYPGAARTVYVPAHDLTEVRFNWRKVAEGVPQTTT